MPPLDAPHSLADVAPLLIVVELAGHCVQSSSGPAEALRYDPRGQALHVPLAPVNLPTNPALQPHRWPPSTLKALVGHG